MPDQVKPVNTGLDELATLVRGRNMAEVEFHREEKRVKGLDLQRGGSWNPQAALARRDAAHGRLERAQRRLRVFVLQEMAALEQASRKQPERLPYA
jgi:hypothetical protein